MYARKLHNFVKVLEINHIIVNYFYRYSVNFYYLIIKTYSYRYTAFLCTSLIVFLIENIEFIIMYITFIIRQYIRAKLMSEKIRLRMNIDYKDIVRRYQVSIS